MAKSLRTQLRSKGLRLPHGYELVKVTKRKKKAKKKATKRRK